MSAEQFQALQKFFPQAEPFTEGGLMGAFLPGLMVDTPSGMVQFDAVLFPHAHSSGYMTRLFTDRTITAPKAQNWNPHSLGGRTWYACSWQGVEAHLPWAEILANHLRAFR